MNEVDIPDPVEDGNGIPLVNGEALVNNAKLAWMHVRYMQLDPKNPKSPNGPQQSHKGIPGYIWYGSLSSVVRDLWPALRDATRDGSVENLVAKNVNIQVNQYLRGTNNMVCLDPGRMDSVSKQRRTHRLPEWWVAADWQPMEWVRPETDTPAVQLPESLGEADVFDSDVPVTPVSADGGFPDLAGLVDEGDGSAPSEPELVELVEDGPIMCRVGCDRVFSSTEGRAVHERNHADVNALLTATAELLVEADGDARSITILDIAERAGVTRQNVHNHFKTRMGMLQAAARLRGAPLLEFDTDEPRPEPVVVDAEPQATTLVPADTSEGPVFVEYTQEEWDTGRRKLMALAAFGARNGTPFSYRMLSQFPWELNTDQRIALLEALVNEGLLVSGTVRNGFGQSKVVTIPADLDAVPDLRVMPAPEPVAGSEPVVVAETDPVAAVEAMVTRYREMERREAESVARVRTAEANAREAEGVRAELDLLKKAVENLRSAALGLPL